MKMLAQGQPLDFNERSGNPSTIRQAAIGTKISLYPGTAKELPLYPQPQKKELQVKTKQVIQTGIS